MLCRRKLNNSVTELEETNYKLQLNESIPCFYCNGYYGPTNGEYLCSTCHLFIQADTYFSNACVVPWFPAQDENDSGNDEPNEDGPSSRNLPTTPRKLFPREYLTKRINELTVPRKDNLPDSAPVDFSNYLPTEVMLVLFTYLDDISLWAVSNVCKRWRKLVLLYIPDSKWKHLVEKFWPYYSHIVSNEKWYFILSKLINDSPCKTCLFWNMSLPKIMGIDTDWRKSRLRSELKTLRTETVDGVKAVPLDRTYCHWSGYITGPTNSPYEGGIFYLYILVPYSYPMKPPKIRFLTKIFHPNISRHGDIGLDCISSNWSLVLTVTKLLLSVQSLLTDPYCSVSMEPDVAKLYQTNRKQFTRIAREWTWRYAMADILR